MSTSIGTYATRAAVEARLTNSSSFNAADESLIDDLCDAFNAWLEQEMGRPVCPRTETTVYLDGYLAEDDGTSIPIPFGVNQVADLKVEVAAVTGGTFHDITSNCFLRPLPMLRRPGWPCTKIRITDVPTSGYAIFTAGYANIRLSGTPDTIAGTPTTTLTPFGWPAIPDELIRLANDAVVRAFTSRQGGESDIIGVDEKGQPIVSWRISARDRLVIAEYSLKPPAAGGGPLVTAWGG